MSVATGGATAHNLTYNANGFLIQNNTLTLNGTTPTIFNTINTTNTISSVIAGSAGLTKTNAGTLILTGTNTYTGTTTISVGELDFSPQGSNNIGAINVGFGNNNTAVLGITSGILNFGGNTIQLGNSATVGQVAIVNQKGGTVMFTNGNAILNGNGAGRICTYNLSGGILSSFASSTRGVTLGVNSGGNATFNLSGTGNLSLGAGTLMVGRSDSTPTNCTVAYNQSGGTATVGTLTIGGGSVQTNTTATFSITNGSFSAASFTTLVGNASSSATMTLGGAAQVTLPAFPAPVGTANLTLDFTTGYVSPYAASTSYLGGLSHVYLTANGAKFNVPSGNDITVAQVLQDAPSQAGTLTKSGSGNLTLTGTNTYTGGTIVNAGILEVDGSLASGSSVTVNSSGTITGSGLINGSVTLNGEVTASVGQAIRFNSSLSLSSSSTTYVEVARNGAALTNSTIQVAGTVNYGGTLFVDSVGISPLRVGDRFQIFNAGNYNGSITNIISTQNYLFSSTNLATDGSIVVTWVGDFANDVLAPGPEGMNVDYVWSGEVVNFDLLTLQNVQIASYYNASRQLVTGARNLNSSQWYYITNDTTFAGWDLHNYIAMGVDTAGNLHITGNYHNQPMNYYRSISPVTNASQFQDANFIQRVSPVWNAAFEKYSTYPVFMMGPNQEFIFNYREHSDTNATSGEDFILKYDTSTKTFSNPTGLNPVFAWTNIYGVYPEYFVYGGYIHAIYLWRADSGVNGGDTNFRLSYARTKDLTNWTDAFGRVLTLPITQYATLPIVDDIPIHKGLLNNQPQLGFDRDGVPLAVYSRFDANSNSQVYVARPISSTLTWKIAQLTTNNSWGLQLNNISTTNGSGSVNNSFIKDEPYDGLSTVSVSMTDPYGKADPNSGLYTFDEATLTNFTGIGKDPINNYISSYTPNAYSGKSDTNGLENLFVDPTTGASNVISRLSSDGVGFAKLHYYLRWEALPSDRSFMPKYDSSGNLITPPSSVLHLYRTQAEFADSVYGVMLKPDDASLSGPMIQTAEPARTFAYYLSSPVNGAPSPINGMTNYAVWTFNITSAGEYTMGGSVYGANTSSDSFYVQIDNEDYITWHLKGLWHYEPVTDGTSLSSVRFMLTSGVHTLRLYAREADARVEYMWLDKASTKKVPSLGPINYTNFNYTADARAFSGYALSSPTNSTPTNCAAHYEIPLPQSGNCILLGRTKAANGNSDSFYISLNGSVTNQLWTLPISGTNWVWAPVQPKLNFTNNPITIDVYGREGGAALDSFMLLKVP